MHKMELFKKSIDFLNSLDVFGRKHRVLTVILKSFGISKLSQSFLISRFYISH